MKFQTMTSEYDISADSFGIMTLEKTAILPCHTSKVEVGRKFYAKRGDAVLFGTEDKRQLYFRNMHTSHVPEYEELTAWLDKQRNE